MAHLNSEHAVADATAHPRAFCTIEFNRYFIKDDDEWIDVCTFIEGEEKTLHYALKTSKLPLHGSNPTCNRVFAYIYKQKLGPECSFSSDEKKLCEKADIRDEVPDCLKPIDDY